jgi:catechol 2,3-dioxygenase-like lactoylglutathione lyase family enzyme
MARETSSRARAAAPPARRKRKAAAPAVPSPPEAVAIAKDTSTIPARCREGEPLVLDLDVPWWPESEVERVEVVVDRSPRRGSRRRPGAIRVDVFMRTLQDIQPLIYESKRVREALHGLAAGPYVVRFNRAYAAVNRRSATSEAWEKAWQVKVEVVPRPPGGLGSSAVMAFVATTDAARATTFYRDVLGLELLSDEPYALVFDAGGTLLRAQKVEEHEPPCHTVLGWRVDDIRGVIADLVARGVTFERFPFFEQDDLGVWATPGGASVAWFKDPDGNTLSLTQLGA